MIVFNFTDSAACARSQQRHFIGRRTKNEESSKKVVLITHSFRHRCILANWVHELYLDAKLMLQSCFHSWRQAVNQRRDESFFRTTTYFLPPSPTVPASSFRLFWTGQKLHLGGSSLSEWKTPNPLLRFGIAWSNNTFQTLGMAFKKQNQFYVLSDYQKGAVFWYRRCGGRQILLSVTWDL